MHRTSYEQPLRFRLPLHADITVLKVETPKKRKKKK
jgi:hypothetical protein